MGKLIIHEADGSTVDIPLDKPRLTIGRHPENDICFDDMAVSGRHAIVHCDGQEALVEDLDSTNGTLVNGRAISRATLMPGDTIAIGRNRLVYASQDWAEEDAPLAGTGSGDSMRRLPVGKLRVDSGSGVGRELELGKPLTTVGKPGQCIVAISRRADGYFISDAGSTPTRPRPSVNGEPLGDGARALKHEDHIEVGGTQLSFLLI